MYLGSSTSQRPIRRVPVARRVLPFGQYRSEENGQRQFGELLGLKKFKGQPRKMDPERGRRSRLRRCERYQRGKHQNAHADRANEYRYDAPASTARREEGEGTPTQRRCTAKTSVQVAWAEASAGFQPGNKHVSRNRSAGPPVAGAPGGLMGQRRAPSRTASTRPRGQGDDVGRQRAGRPQTGRGCTNLRSARARG